MDPAGDAAPTRRFARYSVYRDSGAAWLEEIPAHWSHRQDDKGVTHASLKTIAAFLNTEGGDLLLGVADNGAIVGIELDRLDNDDKFMRHLAQIVRNGFGDRAGTCIDPKTQMVQGKTVCVVSCQRSPEPVFLKWKGLEATPSGDFSSGAAPEP